MGRLPHSEPASRRDEIVRAAMTHAGVDHLANRLYPGLSGGERQRVQFARVLAQIWQAPEEPQQARLLLLDEPTSALDLKYQHQLLAMARALAGRNTAVLVVLHDLNLAARYADRLVMLEQGRLMADGSAGEVLTPALIARLYGYPAQVIHHPRAASPWWCDPPGADSNRAPSGALSLRYPAFGLTSRVIPWAHQAIW